MWVPRGPCVASLCGVGMVEKCGGSSGASSMWSRQQHGASFLYVLAPVKCASASFRPGAKAFSGPDQLPSSWRGPSVCRLPRNQQVPRVTVTRGWGGAAPRPGQEKWAKRGTWLQTLL